MKFPKDTLAYDIQSGISPTIISKKLKEDGYNGMDYSDPMHLLLGLSYLSKDMDYTVEVAKAILSNTNEPSFFGKEMILNNNTGPGTPLHACAFFGNWKLAQYLITQGAKTDLGRTIMYIHGKETPENIKANPKNKLEQMYNPDSPLRNKEAFSVEYNAGFTLTAAEIAQAMGHKELAKAIENNDFSTLEQKASNTTWDVLTKTQQLFTQQ